MPICNPNAQESAFGAVAKVLFTESAPLLPALKVCL